MKKLRKLSLNNKEIVSLDNFEMRNMKGGTGTWNPETQSYWLPEVTVYGTKPDNSEASCPYCQAFFNQNGYFEFQQGNPILGSILTYGQILMHYCFH